MRLKCQYIKCGFQDGGLQHDCVITNLLLVL